MRFFCSLSFARCQFLRHGNKSTSFSKKKEVVLTQKKRIAAAKVLPVGKIWEEGEEEFAN